MSYTIKGGFHIKGKKITAESLEKMEKVLGRKLNPLLPEAKKEE